jgi:biotin transporter BioY
MWTLIVAAVVLLLWGWFVLSFLEEPSVVDRLRIALLVVGVGSIVAAIACAVGAAAIRLRRSSLVEKLK